MHAHRTSPNVVIGEENEEIRILLKEYLETRGYSVFAFPSARELEDALGSTAPDFFLLNVGEEETWGLSLLEKIRDRDEYDQVPVVMLSGENDPAVNTQCVTLGADGVLTWPYSPETLAQNMDALLSGQNTPLIFGDGR